MTRATIIAGGGASGVLFAAALLRRSKNARVIIVEPREELGRGVAYSTDCSAHLLNVPAANMSAFPDKPDDFVQWLKANTPESADATSFAPRSIYGDYISAIASREREAAGARWQHARAFAHEARIDDAGVRVLLSDGATVHGDSLVIATGNAAPAAWPGTTSGNPGGARFFGSAWEKGALVPGSANETVLLLGTGLTAVDAVLGLRRNGHRGTMYMVSRRGLFPHEHRLFDTPPEARPDATSIRDLIGVVRGENWRAILDRLRPHANTFWQAQALSDQRQFMRHLMPYWNVHRHRLSPEAAKEVAGLIAGGSLRIVAGRTGEVESTPRGLRVSIKLRGETETLNLEPGRIINCSGPEHDFRKLPNPLIQSLLAAGVMTPHPLGIGVAVDENGALIGATSVPSKRVFAIGPVRYGTLIETTAIPEIRVQARDLADFLAEDAAMESAS